MVCNLNIEQHGLKKKTCSGLFFNVSQVTMNKGLGLIVLEQATISSAVRLHQREIFVTGGRDYFNQHRENDLLLLSVISEFSAQNSTL